MYTHANQRVISLWKVSPIMAVFPLTNAGLPPSLAGRWRGECLDLMAISLQYSHNIDPLHYWLHMNSEGLGRSDRGDQGGQGVICEVPQYRERRDEAKLLTSLGPKYANLGYYWFRLRPPRTGDRGERWILKCYNPLTTCLILIAILREADITSQDQQIGFRFDALTQEESSDSCWRIMKLSTILTRPRKASRIRGTLLCSIVGFTPLYIRLWSPLSLVLVLPVLPDLDKNWHEVFHLARDIEHETRSGSYYQTHARHWVGLTYWKIYQELSGWEMIMW